MIEVSRRSFLIGTGTVTALAVVNPSLLLNESIPTLWKDGIHDDAPALNALLSGGLAKSPEGIVFSQPTIIGGEYLISQTLQVKVDNVRVLNGLFKVSSDFGDEAILECKSNTNALFAGCIFIGNEETTAIVIKDI